MWHHGEALAGEGVPPEQRSEAGYQTPYERRPRGRKCDGLDGGEPVHSPFFSPQFYRTV